MSLIALTTSAKLIDAFHSPARGTALGVMSWERGHLARIGPKARKAPTGATRLSRPLPRPRHGPGSDGVSRKRRRRVRLMWRASGPLAGGTPALPEGPGSDVLGARASCPHRAEGPQGADRSDTPEPPTPPPEAWLWE